MRLDIGLSIFIILLTMFIILYCSRVHAHHETKEEIFGHWWMHVDGPHTWVEVRDHNQKNKDSKKPYNCQKGKLK